ncbi:MAG: ABC transporter substrate-binding protein [Methylobacteriaceae bacterium]|nr:ABC transporter substrate-binding protein [Methylobacteriaceae bacterium]
MLRASLSLLYLASFVLAAGAQETAPAAKDLAKNLSPGGKLRVAINFGNPVLAQRGPNGEPRGVSAALARELAKRLNVSIDFVTFEEAGKVAEAAAQDKWDIAFLAIDPKRAATIDFTPPYVLIEGTYLTPAGSPLQKIEDVDKDGIRVAVAENSAYDLYLTRSLKHAKLMRGTDSAAAVKEFEQGKTEVLAGVRQPLDDYARSHPNTRVMDGRFMSIQQAMCSPKGRETGARYLRDFVEEMKRSGFVAKALQESGQTATVAPAAG